MSNSYVCTVHVKLANASLPTRKDRTLCVMHSTGMRYDDITICSSGLHVNYVCVHINTRTHSHTHTHLHACTHTYTHAHTHTHSHRRDEVSMVPDSPSCLCGSMLCTSPYSLALCRNTQQYVHVLAMAHYLQSCT